MKDWGLNIINVKTSNERVRFLHEHMRLKKTIDICITELIKDPYKAIDSFLCIVQKFVNYESLLKIF